MNYLKTCTIGILFAGLLFLTGCATKSELEELKTEVEQNRQISQAAVVCCQIEQQRLDQFYRKVMSK